MKVLITGAQGQLGQDVTSICGQAGLEVTSCSRAELDITDEDQCLQVVTGHRPDCIIHCAAYTAVDAAESDLDGAFRVNAIGTRNVAMAAERVGCKLVYISTDYVFNGHSDKPYQEYDLVDPQTVYGKSKYAGEQIVRDFCTRWFIVRTSWVFGIHGSNFVKTMLRLGQEKPLLQVVHDQKGSPTYTVDLARFLVNLISTEKYGIYHASNSGSCTWFEFTEAIFTEAKKELNLTITAKLEPCTTEQFPRPAKRPSNSVMEHLAIRVNDLEELPHWKDGLRRFMLEMKQQPDLYL
ncbi:dTDP-4-dehydrorhamnose reductase [Paenibacillus campinasensis]|uniref:dTDP-4-dehydrorhamnose reductase n=1 Tax=Paenibacillus campinasensis TaxID=66347 RepID=A0A268EFH2_9BACL|nr:dTDP-4-dehydrorhamnose reductase [Paenibacillus campinasensis]PAD71871.1 dTDP-4-dehydrorhamnose reductase [Paenibacillus campinasensis]